MSLSVSGKAAERGPIVLHARPAIHHVHSKFVIYCHVFIGQDESDAEDPYRRTRAVDVSVCKLSVLVKNCFILFFLDRLIIRPCDEGGGLPLRKGGQAHRSQPSPPGTNERALKPSYDADAVEQRRAESSRNCDQGLRESVSQTHDRLRRGSMQAMQVVQR